jgi:acyl carrier protein phosphodiesterase
MNYLAHALLSGDDPEVLIGNMAADSLKGALPPELLPSVLRGVHLHRRIDRYTDTSVEFSACMAVFRPSYGICAHVLVDIAFDHLLSRSWGSYSAHAFSAFVHRVYSVLRTNRAKLPSAFIPVADRMCSHDWLTSYRSLKGLAAAYARIARRLDLPPGYFAEATGLIEERLDDLTSQFNSLFPRVSEMARLTREAEG